MKNEKNCRKKRIFRESDDEGVFVVFGFFFQTQVQFKIIKQTFVENFMGYLNM